MPLWEPERLKGQKIAYVPTISSYQSAWGNNRIATIYLCQKIWYVVIVKENGNTMVHYPAQL